MIQQIFSVFCFLLFSLLAAAHTKLSNVCAEQGITTWRALVMACLPSATERRLLENLPMKLRKGVQTAINEGRAKFTEAWTRCKHSVQTVQPFVALFARLAD